MIKMILPSTPFPQWQTIQDYDEAFKAHFGRYPSAISFPSFVELYNSQYGRKTSTFHLEMAQWIHDTDADNHRILLAYRFAGKRFLTQLWNCWKLMNDPDWSSLIVRANQYTSAKSASFIKKVMENFPLVSHLVPRDPDKWRQNEITVVRSIPDPHPSISSTSIDSGFTGAHVVCLVLDDIEVPSNTRTIEACDRLETVVGEFSQIAGKEFVLGTPHRDETDRIYWKMMRSENNYTVRKWPVFFDVPNKITQACRDKIPIKIGQGKEASIQDAAWVQSKLNSTGMNSALFASQFLLEPKQSGTGVLKVGLVKVGDYRVQTHYDDYRETTAYTVDGKRIVDYLAMWDPASSTAGNDQSYLRMLAATFDGHVYVTYCKSLCEIGVSDAMGQYKDISAQCVEVIKACGDAGLTLCHCERNYQETLPNQLKLVAKEMGKRLDVIGFRRKTVRKTIFIFNHLENLIETGRFHVHQGFWGGTGGCALKEQIRKYPSVRHDDAIDSVALGVMWLTIPGFSSGEGELSATPWNRIREKERFQVNDYATALQHIFG